MIATSGFLTALECSEFISGRAPPRLLAGLTGLWKKAEGKEEAEGGGRNCADPLFVFSAYATIGWWWGEDADLKMDRVTADAQSDHHWQPGTWWSSSPPCWCVLVAVLPRWSAGQLSTRQHNAQDVTEQQVQIWRVSVNHDSSLAASSAQCSGTRTLRNAELSSLKQHNFVIFRCISTKLGDKVHICIYCIHDQFLGCQLLAGCHNMCIFITRDPNSRPDSVITHSVLRDEATLSCTLLLTHNPSFGSNSAFRHLHITQ